MNILRMEMNIRYMKEIIVLLVVMTVVLMYMWYREHTLRIRIEKEAEENDRELTKYISSSLDMEKHLSEVERDLKLQQEMAEEIKRIQEKSRLLKHDMRNHSLVLLSYLNEGNVEEAKLYISQIIDNLNKIYSYINVGNSLLNYILNSKLSMAKDKGIDIKAEIENMEFNYMSSVDFSALLNNMLDNAIEAGEKSGEKSMELIIGRRQGFDTITVKNSIDTSVLDTNPELKSTKKEKGHGFGVTQIKSIVEKYEGMIDIYEEGNYFIVNVVYPSKS